MSEAESYLAVLKASYDYYPQSDDEVAIQEGQLLFLLERVDDDWWKVKIKSDSQEEETQAGLVPAAYVEQAEHSSVVKALYDYEAAAPGELTIHEDEILIAFDREEDWLLVQTQKGGKAGFVPVNYVEAYAEEQDSPSSQIVVPAPAQRPTSTYVDPADRVASTKVNADGIQTWSVSEVDKKGKKKKGTLGIGNGALFFASEADKTPVQKWSIQEVVNMSVEKGKHIVIEIGGAASTSLHFHAGSKDNVEAIVAKLDNSKTLAAAASISRDSSEGRIVPASGSAQMNRETKKPTVHFSSSSPEVIPSADVDDYEEEVVPYNGMSGGPGSRTEAAIVLYDFTADGEDELSVVEGERLVVLETEGDEWWKCRNQQGDVGVVPASYIEISDSGGKAGAQVVSQEEINSAAEKERLQREKAERVAQEQEREEARKNAEVQRRAKEAAAAAEEERKKRKEASARRASTPINEMKKTIPENDTSRSSRTSTESNCPPPDRIRVWHDRTGQFRVEAAFLGINDGKLRLHKVNGVVVEVPREKMSVEDLEFVERLTSKKSQPSGLRQVSDDDIPLALARPSVPPTSRSAPPPQKASKIDWFDFFLSAGCDMDDCTRYASSFERDKIDESILPDITESIMRSLGVREGDIIRITKAIEKRKSTDNLIKPGKQTEEQIRRDEELARKIQAQESVNARSSAPNLFVAGPGGALKNPRRGRPQPSKSVPPAMVDIKAISTASENLQRTSSPQILTPSSANASSSPIQGPPRSDSTTQPVSGFGDDAWTNRPSSTKPLSGTPTPHTPPIASPLATVPTTASPAPVTSAPLSITQASVPSPAPTSGTVPLAKTNESDIFDQLARLADLRKQTPASVQTPAAPNHALRRPSSASPSVIPTSYQAGLGMGTSSASLGQHLDNLQVNATSSQSGQAFSGPRGPFAPVPANQRLLQPLIPTQTNFNAFIPTRPASSAAALVSPFQNPVQPSYMVSQPTGVPLAQPIISQSTSVPFNGLNPVQNANIFTPIQPQYTAFNPNFGQSQSPFNNGFSSPPPIPPVPSSVPASSSSIKDTSPANIFAQMKSGTFANDNPTNAQPPPLTTQTTGWGPAFHGGFMGYQH